MENVAVGTVILKIAFHNGLRLLRQYGWIKVAIPLHQFFSCWQLFMLVANQMHLELAKIWQRMEA